MATTTNYREARAAGLVMVGEWGPGRADEAGGVWCRPEDRAAVAAAYDAVGEFDLGPDALAGVLAAGGVFVPDAR